MLLQVPKALHGSIYNDGWFGSGAAWSPDESRLAYVAEVHRPRELPAAVLLCHSNYVHPPYLALPAVALHTYTYQVKGPEAFTKQMSSLLNVTPRRLRL